MAGSEGTVISVEELTERLTPILAKYDGNDGAVISLLQDVQEEFGFLEEGAMSAVAGRLNLPLSHLYGVASFYSQFYFEPRGKNIVRVCTGTACHIRGAPAIQAKLEEELGVLAGETTDDLAFTLETVNCVGCCALAPVAVVGEQVVRKKDLLKTIASLKATLKEPEE